MPRNLGIRPRTLALVLLALTMAPALAGAPSHPYTVLADAGYDLVVPQMATNDIVGAAEIREVMDAYVATVDAGDLDAWLALWEPGGIQMPPGTSMRTGITAIRAGMRPGFTQYDDDIRIDVLEATIASEFAYARGTYTLRMTPKVGRRGEFGDLTTVDGKFLTVLHRQPDGSWRIYRDIFNSNVPPR